MASLEGDTVSLNRNNQGDGMFGNWI